MNTMPTFRSRNTLLLAFLIAFSPIARAQPTNAPATDAKATVKPMDLFADVIVAKGDGVSVSRAALDEALITIKASAAARGQQIPPEAMRTLEAQVLSRMIGMQVLNQEATAADKTAGREAAEKQLDAMKKAAGDDDNFARQLKTVGLTIDELVKKMTSEATADAVLRRELKVEVTDAEVKKFYDENPSQFEKPELVRAAHILIGTREPGGEEMSAEKKKEKRALAESIQKRAKDGEDFAKLAKEYSDDPGSKDDGGEYTFPRGQMVPEFEAVAFSQETNQVSGLVTTQYGYHIIKTLEKTPAKKIEVAEASDNIRRFLADSAIQKKIPGYMEKRERDAHVEILDKELKSIIDEANETAKKAESAAADASK
jgi:peptidyl-prolyl cis-trans isomerase C